MTTYAQAARNEGERRLEMTRRILIVIGMISPLRNGATLAELTEDVCMENGQVCQRTIYRDLALLEELGLVERRLISCGTHQWRWLNGNRLSDSLAQAAEQFAEYEPPAVPKKPIGKHPWRQSAMSGRVMPKGIT